MDCNAETELREEMEQLRQELHNLLAAEPDRLNSPKACALSARLDLLIARYMSVTQRQFESGN